MLNFEEKSIITEGDFQDDFSARFNRATPLFLLRVHRDVSLIAPNKVYLLRKSLLFSIHSLQRTFFQTLALREKKFEHDCELRFLFSIFANF